jgi:Tfp pilus assembly protein PilV
VLRWRQVEKKIKMSHHKSPNSRKGPNSPNLDGFSLIELVFAMLFLTIIVLGVVNLQSSNLAMMNGQKNQIQAHFLAKQGLQIVRSLGSISCTPVSPATYCDKLIDAYQLKDKTSGSTDWEKITKGTAFQRRIRLTPTPEGLTVATKVTAIVEWDDSTGSHSFAQNSHVEASLIVQQ